MNTMNHTLVRLLAQSQSAHDPEALSAIRLANELLKKHDKTWYDLIPEHTATEPPRAAPAADAAPDTGDDEDDETNWGAEIARLLRTEKWINPGGRDFLTSVAEQYRKKGSISHKQVAAVRRFMR